MKIAQLLLVSFFLITCENKEPQSAQIEQDSPDLNTQIDAYFSALNGLGKFNGVVYVQKKGDLVLHKAYNLNQDTTSTTYVHPNSQFDIHSVSKLMAHYLIEKFEIEGELSKTQKVVEFIPDFPRGDEISISMLLDHSSGLPRRFEQIEGDAIDLATDEIIEYTKKQPLIFDPGTDYQYSNVAYEIVYYILEEVCKQPFSQCLMDELFVPLNMQHSGAHFYAKPDRKQQLSRNHEKKDSLIVQVANILPEELKTARIFSTAEDLNLFLDHIRQEPYASLLKNESGVIEKSGGSDGIRVEIYTNLKAEYNFIFLSNFDEIPFQKTVEDLAKILEGKPYVVPKDLNREAITLSKDILERYEGAYNFADMGDLTLTFTANETGLSVFQEGELAGKILPENEHVFFEDPKEPESFEFVQDDSGSYHVLMGWKGVKLKGVKR